MAWAMRCCITSRGGHAPNEIPPTHTQRNWLYGLLLMSWCSQPTAPRCYPPPTHHSGGDAVAARGEMCVCGATNLVGGATGASLAGGSMLECCGFTASGSCRSDGRIQRCERSGPCRPHSFCLALEQPRRSVGGRKGNVSSPLYCRGQWWAMQPPSP